MLELILKLTITPENILGLLVNIIGIVAIALIFREWQEKWWKSLIPFYSTYLTYKHSWKHKGFFLLELLMLLVNNRCLAIPRKHIVGNVFDTIAKFAETNQWTLEIDVRLLVICAILGILSFLIYTIMKYITYYKIIGQLYSNWFLILLVLIAPDLGLMISYLLYKKAKKKT